MVHVDKVISGRLTPPFYDVRSDFFCMSGCEFSAQRLARNLYLPLSDDLSVGIFLKKVEKRYGRICADFRGGSHRNCMSITIGSNIASLRTRRLLDVNTAKVATVTERLSSGLRINRPSDDPAGLATASALDVKQRLYTKALSNANDAISLLSITDGHSMRSRVS